DATTEARRGDREEDPRPAGRPVRRFVRQEVRLDSRFDLAADDGGREATHRLGGRPRPVRRLRGDHDARGAHVERFGERIGDSRVQNLGILMRPPHRLLLFSSQEYSMISQSGLRVKVRALVNGLVYAFGSSTMTSYLMWPRSGRVKRCTTCS